jgi:hypothetical protein
MHKLALGVALCLVALLTATAAPAALSPEQFKCQNTVAKQGRKLFKKTFNFLAKCEADISKGKLPVGTDCSVNAATKIGLAETKFSQKVMDKCPDSPTNIVASLDFGGQCFGVTMQADLITCSIEEHNQAARRLIDIVFADVGRRCDGGTNDGDPCTSDAQCPPSGVCVPLDPDQRKCQKLLGKTVVKHANKRLGTIQRCKKKVAKDDLPADTDCVINGQAKLADLLAKSIDKIDLSCPGAVTASLEFGGVCEGQTETAAVTACALCLDDREADDLIQVQYGSNVHGATASVEQIADTADCVDGPLSRCRVGDYLLKNDRIRVVVQDVQRNLFGIGQFGGQIIDGDLVRQGADPDRDNFEEWSVSLNIENTAHYTSLTVINDGSNGGPAILRASGVDDLLDFLNPSSVVAGFNLTFPSTADDLDLDVTVMTDYILEPGTNYVRVETTVQNMSAGEYPIFFGDFLGGSGQVELFQSGYGFGEPLVATTCPTTPNNECNFVAYSGEDEADGVSYGYIHDTPHSSTFTTSGVAVPQLGVEIVRALAGFDGPPFTLEALNDPGDSLTFTRYFVVGDGSVSSITDARNEIGCLATGRLSGNVTADGNPAERADVAILSDTAPRPGNGGLPFSTMPLRNVITHVRTDDQGDYSLTLPVGTYKVVANLDGYPYEGGGAAPMEHVVVISAFQETVQDMALPATGSLRVLVEDQDTNDIAAKASVVGFDPSADPLNTQSLVAGLINSTTAVFGERFEDGVPYGVARVLFIGPSGDSGVIPIEPPTDPDGYQVFVSHGPEYSVHSENVTAGDVTSGAVVNAQVVRVVDTTGFISGDFHVHSINSPDSEVSQVERVQTMLAEGVDFFAATDHDILSDFSSSVTDAGGTGLITVATGSEITTFDYGHFNAWPMTIDPSQANGGSVDHGGAAPDGEDFPVPYMNYSETPADIIALAKNSPQPGATTVQINHIHSHFGLDGGSGLAIDTGVDPPQSGVPAAGRRLDPLITNFFTDTFDALEIWIGDSRGQIRDNFLGLVPTGRGGNIGDWFNLINQGIVRTGVADSDTHNRIITQAGIPRSMVASTTDDAGSLSSAAVSTNVNGGRVVGTNAPMVRITAFAGSTGQSGGLDVGRCTGVVDCTSVEDCPPCTDTAQCGVGETCTALPTTIETTDGEVEIRVDVQSPAWAEFDTIEFYINTTTTLRTLTGIETGAGQINLKRYSITPDVVHVKDTDFTVDSEVVNGSTRLEAETELNLNGLTEDIWVVALVKGTDGVSKPLFPVVPNSILGAGTNDTVADLLDGNLNESGITALAFTNPIFIDVDGGGWDAPGVQVNP